MVDKLEFIVNKNTQVVSIGKDEVEIGHAYYHDEIIDNYIKLQIFCRDRVPTNVNNSNIARIYYGMKVLSKEKYTDIIVDNYYVKKNSGRVGLEIKIPKDKYTLKII